MSSSFIQLFAFAVAVPLMAVPAFAGFKFKLPDGKQTNMKPMEQTFGKLTALTITPESSPTRAIVLLHGVGSNERNLLSLGANLFPDRLVVSLRAPLTMGADAYGWFEVQFRSEGPVHNWEQAKSSLFLLEEALADLGKKSGISADHISIFGFSQGAIMTVGLALQSSMDFEAYMACAGRTLPEFAEGAKKSPPSTLKSRKILVAHGTKDSKLPVQHGKKTESLIRALGLKLTYKEYPADHVVPNELLEDIRLWMK